MTTPWNGLPDQPEQKGWHWVSSKLKPNAWLLQKWIPECRKWNGPFGIDPIMAANLWFYGCRALSPCELAQMRKDERERCLDIAIYERGNFPSNPEYRTPSSDTAYRACNRIIEAIRALTDDEGMKS